MSSFKRFDHESEDSDFVYDEDFDPESFVEAMGEFSQSKGRAKDRTRRRRLARELIERRAEDRWLRDQLSEFDDESLFQ